MKKMRLSSGHIIPEISEEEFFNECLPYNKKEEGEGEEGGRKYIDEVIEIKDGFQIEGYDVRVDNNKLDIRVYYEEGGGEVD